MVNLFYTETVDALPAHNIQVQLASTAAAAEYCVAADALAQRSTGIQLSGFSIVPIP